MKLYSPTWFEKGELLQGEYKIDGAECVSRELEIETRTKDAIGGICVVILHVNKAHRTFHNEIDPHKQRAP